MLGVTNSINDNWKQAHIYKYSHLNMWFDGVETKNKAPTKTDVVMASMKPTAGRLSNEAYNGRRVPAYYQSDPGIWNGFFIAHVNPNTYFTWDSCTLTLWGYRMADTTVNPIFYILSTENSLIFNILFKNGTANQGFARCTNAIGQEFAWSNNTWKFIACTISPTTVAVYINGSLLSSAARTQTYQPGWSDCYMMSGNWQRDYAGGIGKATDLRLYDYTMTANEILQLYNTGPQWHK